MFILAGLILLLLILLTFVVLHYRKLIKRRLVAKKELTPEERQVLEQYDTWQKLSKPDREKLSQHIQIFLDEKKIMNLNMGPMQRRQELEVAYRACLPLTARKTNYYGHIDELRCSEKNYRCYDNKEEEISWFGELYQQFTKEQTSNKLSKEDFIKKSQEYFDQKAVPQEIKNFYQIHFIQKKGD